NFSSEEACRDYLASLRWPKIFLCPACGHEESWRLADGLFKFKKCNRKTSAISGTIFGQLA
ncbi:MAG: transposase, partial [Kiritimatiellales bacterium]